MEEELEPQVKNFSIPLKLRDVVSKLVQLKHVAEGAFFYFLEKNGYFNAI